MIRLKVEEYCHDCRHFVPELDTNSIFENGYYVTTDTTIRCEFWDRCAVIARHMEEKRKGGEVECG